MHLPPPHHGASTVGMQLKNSELIKRKFDSFFLNISTSSTFKFSFHKSLINYLKTLTYIFRLLSKNKPDLVYYTISSNGIAFLKDFFLIFIFSLKFKRIILHFHNKGVVKGNFFFKPLYYYIFKNCHIILLSERLVEDIVHYNINKSLNICYNGIPLPKNDLIQKNNLVYKYDFLFLSNLIREKGIEDFVFACHKIKESINQNFRAAIVGKSADINLFDLKNILKEKNLLNNVDVLGPLYGEDKFNIYRESKIFVFPTFYHFECFPLVLLEAMSFKMPLISTNEGAIEDLLINGYNGIIVQKNNPDELSSAMGILLNDPDKRNSMGEKSYNHYINNFTEKHFIDNFIKIMERTLKYE